MKGKENEFIGRKAFGDRLRKLLSERKKRKDPPVNARQLGLALGGGRLGATTAYNWINGKRIPTLYEDWKVLCHIFGVTPQFLLFGEDIGRVQKEQQAQLTELLKKSILLSSGREFTLRVRVELGENENKEDEDISNMIHDLISGKKDERNEG